MFILNLRRDGVNSPAELALAAARHAGVDDIAHAFDCRYDERSRDDGKFDEPERHIERPAGLGVRNVLAEELFRHRIFKKAMNEL
jgi:hypothetical protein